MIADLQDAITTFSCVFPIFGEACDSGISKGRLTRLERQWHAICNDPGISPNGRREDHRRLHMFKTPSLVSQLGAGILAFAFSAACILAAIGPIHIVG